MPDVSLLDFKTAYTETDAVEVNRRSALALIGQLLRLVNVTEQHLKEQLSIGLWKWTEAAGVAPYAKFNLRYVSEGVRNPTRSTNINHEHVWTRRSIIKTLRSRTWTDEQLKAFLSQFGVACVVTVAEHGQLSRSGSKAEGWQRYLDAGIPVWDRQTGQRVDLDELRPHDPLVAPADVPLEPQTEAPETEEGARPPSADLDTLLAGRARPQTAERLRRLIRMARFASAVAVPSARKNGEPSDYFRIHDTMISEPTAAVAYPHWTGRVSFLLVGGDLPNALQDDPRVKFLQGPQYAVQVKITDDESTELAAELLLLSLEKLRGQS